MADHCAERVGGLGGLWDVNAGTAEGGDERGRTVVADEIDEILEHRRAAGIGAWGGMRDAARARRLADGDGAEGLGLSLKAPLILL